MLQELGKQNPQLLRLIQENQAEFLQLLNEPYEGSDGLVLYTGDRFLVWATGWIAKLVIDQSNHVYMNICDPMTQCLLLIA